MTTSNTKERAAGCSDWLARSHAPPLVLSARRTMRRDGTRERRKINEATPVAAITSTDSSPKVSQARVSTRMTLTTLRPYPKS